MFHTFLVKMYLNLNLEFRFKNYVSFRWKKNKRIINLFSIKEEEDQNDWRVEAFSFYNNRAKCNIKYILEIFMKFQI